MSSNTHLANGDTVRTSRMAVVNGGISGRKRYRGYHTTSERLPSCACRCLFPGASAFRTFRPVTNPHEFSVDGVHFLGTSGQNIDDVYKCASYAMY